DFIADDQAKTIYAVNNTPSTLTVTFQEDVEVSGTYGVQTESFALPPRNAADVTNDIEIYTNDGTLSANYQNGTSSTAMVGAGRLGVLTLPILAGLTFTAFGGKVTFERKTIEAAGRKVDQWSVKSSSQLTSLLFDYNTKNGEKMHFKAQLKDETASDSSTTDYEYVITMDQEGLATGVLTDFTVTVEAEEQAFAALLSSRQLVSFEDLPARVRTRLRVS
ncbi:MAG TPA: hypothetical protein VF911_18480, partial [Thermoanaerobaculia bacterium]